MIKSMVEVECQGMSSCIHRGRGQNQEILPHVGEKSGVIRDSPFRVRSRVLITYPRPYGVYQVRKPLKSRVRTP